MGGLEFCAKELGLILSQRRALGSFERGSWCEYSVERLICWAACGMVGKRLLCGDGSSGETTGIWL